MSLYPVPVFPSSQAYFQGMLAALSGELGLSSDASALECWLQANGHELMRLLMQETLDQKAVQEEQTIAPMQAADGELRTEIRSSCRTLGTLFGEVAVHRKNLVKRGCSGGLRPLDAALNLPRGTYSFGVAKRLAFALASSSYTDAIDTIRSTTASGIARRQTEDLIEHTVQDFEDFYLDQSHTPARDTDLLVLSFDGSGVVMRPEALREEARKLAAQDRKRSVAETAATCGQRSVGKNRKRMAQVAAIYDVAPHPRSPEEVLSPLRGKGVPSRRPRPTHKRVYASLKRAPFDVMDEAFVNANQRDPAHRRRWVVLLDGNAHQLSAVEHLALSAGVKITVVIDFLHVLGYLWSAGKALVGPAPDVVEAWVVTHSRALLDGKVCDVADDITKEAEGRESSESQAKTIKSCVGYLLNHQDGMAYDRYLRDGLPIATGVIEGACRSLIKDRMDITGARWGLNGAEAILQLRSLRASGDLDEYLNYHQMRELQRNHLDQFNEGELISLRERLEQQQAERFAA